MLYDTVLVHGAHTHSPPPPQQQLQQLAPPPLLGQPVQLLLLPCQPPVQQQQQQPPLKLSSQSSSSSSLPSSSRQRTGLPLTGTSLTSPTCLATGQGARTLSRQQQRSTPWAWQQQPSTLPSTGGWLLCTTSLPVRGLPCEVGEVGGGIEKLVVHAFSIGV